MLTVLGLGRDDVDWFEDVNFMLTRGWLTVVSILYPLVICVARMDLARLVSVSYCALSNQT